MNIGISFYFGYKLDPSVSARMIKESNFNCVMTNADKRFNRDNGSIRKQVRLFKKYDIKLSSLHMRYKSSELFNFWLDNKIGDKLEKNLKKDLYIAKKYGFNCVVIHLKGEYSKIGIDRLKRLLKIARKLNVPIANENLGQRELFIKVMDEINDEYFKFCYDSGHNNAYDKEYDYLAKYGDRLVALHLHDNNGKEDEHTLNRYGTIDWDDLASKLAKCPIVNLDYELLMHKKSDLGAKEALEECYKQGIELLKLIERKKN